MVHGQGDLIGFLLRDVSARTSMRLKSPQVILIAGPNGAGKSTLAPHLLRDSFDLPEYVNADAIAVGLSGFDKYHLNPRPRLILLVEGTGEYEQFPLLARDLFGVDFPRSRILIENLEGVASFTGKKRLDRYGALAKFIDFYHSLQTFVFIVLDREGRT
jgi:hypothetical protein